MAKLVLNGSEMNEDILDTDSHFYEFMTDFFKNKECRSAGISGLTKDQMDHFYGIMRDAQDSTEYVKTVEYQTAYNKNHPEYMCELSVRKYVRKNWKKAGTGSKG